MPQQILVTGSQGFTGKHFISAAQKNGFDIFALRSDITDVQALMTELTNVTPDYVVHLAAISAVTHADEEAFYQVNVIGTLNLLKALVQSSCTPKTVLLASSANVYGNTADSPIKENICPRPVNHYATSKLAMEYMAMNFINQLPIVITRPFNYTGVGQNENFIVPKLVSHFIRKSECIELGNIEVEREFNDVRMVCEVYLALLSQGKKGEIYNICSGEPMSVKTVLNCLQKLTHHKPMVSTNKYLLRDHEIHRLCGSPQKLQSCLSDIKYFTLAQTLTWMLHHSL